MRLVKPDLNASKGFPLKRIPIKVVAWAALVLNHSPQFRSFFFSAKEEKRVWEEEEDLLDSPVIGSVRTRYVTVLRVGFASKQS